MGAKDEAWTAWTLAGNQIVLLDLAQDRYFRLSGPANASVCAAIARGEVTCWSQPHAFPRPDDWAPAEYEGGAAQPRHFSLPGIAASLWLQRRLERRLQAMPFRQVLLDVRTAADTRVRRGRKAAAHELGHLLDDFEYAKLIRSAANRCVPRSLAIVLRCASVGIRAYAVIGVTSEPFQAHCWAQSETLVLGDSVENVKRFTPLLVV